MTVSKSKSIELRDLIYRCLLLVQNGDSFFEAIDDDVVLFLVNREFIIIDPAVIEGMDGTILTSKGIKYLRHYK